MTPIGICLEYYEQKSSFIYVKVNEERVKIYDNGKATVLDACIHAGFAQDSLFPSRGDSVHYKLNGEEREAKGISWGSGRSGSKWKRDESEPAAAGRRPGAYQACDKRRGGAFDTWPHQGVPKEDKRSLFGEKLEYPVKVYVNGKPQDGRYVVREDDRISVDETCRIAELFEYKNIPERDDILLNGEDTTCTHRVTDGDEVKPVPQIKRPPKPPKKAPVSAVVEDLVKEAQKEAEEPAEDPLLAPPKPLPSWAADLPFMTKNHVTQEEPVTLQKYGFAGRKARAGCGRSTRCADNADEDQSRDQWHTDTFAGEGKAGICRSV